MVGDDHDAAGFERREQFSVHLGAVHHQVGGVVIEEEISDEIEVSLLTMVGGRIVYADGPYAALEENPR